MMINRIAKGKSLLQPIRSFSSTVMKNEEASNKNIYAGLILSRIPIVTKDLTDFESKYYEYQSELEKRLMWTFPQYYYFRKGTLSERRFLDANRGPVSYQPGVIYPKGIPDVKHNRERSQKQEIVIPREESAGLQNADESVTRPVIPNSRITKADETNDLKSLERKLPRTLYLLVKEAGSKSSSWKFPSFKITTGAEKTLSEVVSENIQQSSSKELKKWLVSETPTAVLKFNKDAKLVAEDKEPIEKKEYLVKSHIIAGTFEPVDKELFQDYQWCTKEEIAELVDDVYYEKIDCLLSDV